MDHMQYKKENGGMHVHTSTHFLHVSYMHFLYVSSTGGNLIRGMIKHYMWAPLLVEIRMISHL